MADEQAEDWLRRLGEPFGEGPPTPDQPTLPPEPTLGGEALLDDLREQATDLGEIERPPSTGLGGMLLGLAPWQRFVLALLLFLNVALLGCMCLVMAGRVVPFQ